ncbi:PREDICTED: defensin-like protein 163 [Camelina sativa]|uniref:Defensin-like protein 163 n=1 Tax=Camelina sativa TaxID=90675 RepID=A0ABM1QLZ3_CAMSA|nr:PREDICTED: defensin-like protein 163 [Camelina sativa]
MAKLLCSYLLISIFILSALLASPSAEGANIKRCSVNVKLSKPCTFQECIPICYQKYNGNGVCTGNKNQFCTCVYNC